MLSHGRRRCLHAKRPPLKRCVRRAAELFLRPPRRDVLLTAIVSRVSSLCTETLKKMLLFLLNVRPAGRDQEQATDL